MRAASPKGELTALVAPSAIVIVRRDGSALRRIPITAELGINGILQIGWLDAERVWVEGHVTPSSGIFYVWNVRTGERLDERWGSWFAPSPDGKMIAQVEHVPHGSPINSRVVIDGHAVYESDHGHLRHLVWSHDGSMLAFVESSHGTDTVVAIDPTGRVRVRSAASQSVRQLTWGSGSTLRIREGDTTREVVIDR